MSKYSGFFLSFLLIFLCLWINVCRYPRVWTMINGDDSSAEGMEDTLDGTPNSAESSETLETKNDYRDSDISEEPDSWVPKPVIVTARPATETPAIDHSSVDDPDSKSLAGHNVSGGKNPDFFKTANLSSPVDEDPETGADNVSYEKPAKNVSEDGGKNIADYSERTDSDEQTESNPSTETGQRENGQEDGTDATLSSKSVTNVRDQEEKADVKENNGTQQDKSDEKQTEDGSQPSGLEESSNVVILHSPYLAAGSPGTDRLSSAAPAYGVRENQAFPCGAKTVPVSIQK